MRVISSGKNSTYMIPLAQIYLPEFSSKIKVYKSFLHSLFLELSEGDEGGGAWTYPCWFFNQPKWSSQGKWRR
jgi:hypothetical protein